MQRLKYVYFLKSNGNVEQMFRIGYALSTVLYDVAHTHRYFYTLKLISKAIKLIR